MLVTVASADDLLCDTSSNAEAWTDVRKDLFVMADDPVTKWKTLHYIKGYCNSKHCPVLYGINLAQLQKCNIRRTREAHTHHSGDRARAETNNIKQTAAMVTANTSTTPIRIYASGRGSPAAYIFDHDDAFRVRREHRIQGDFIGTLPKHNAQNQYLSLPLALSYDEAYFGLCRGFFTLIDDAPENYVVADEGRVARFFEERAKEVEEQAESTVCAQMAERARRTKGMKRAREELAVEEEEEEEEDTREIGVRDTEGCLEEEVVPPPQKVARIGLLRRVGRTLRSALSVFVPRFADVAPMNEGPAAAQVVVMDEELGIVERAIEDENKDKREVERQAALEARLRHQARQTALVMTSTQRRRDECCDSGGKKVKLKLPHGASAERMELRGQVFAALHDRGYYLSCGAKFGADFLAYAGDPVLFHAALAVVVVERDEEVSALDVVALGRLGDSTKKRLVLAYLDEEVKFVGVQWEETLP